MLLKVGSIPLRTSPRDFAIWLDLAICSETTFHVSGARSRQVLYLARISLDQPAVLRMVSLAGNCSEHISVATFYDLPTHGKSLNTPCLLGL